MSRKTSKFIRKRTAQGRIIGSAVFCKRNAWLERIKFSRAYDGESICGEAPSSQIADAAVANAQLALQKLINRAVEKSDTDPHDLMAHCIGITQIRVLDMGGVNANDAMERLNLAASSLLRVRKRWERTGQWVLDGPAITDLHDALDIYEAILRGSSPQLMENAQMVRLDQVKRAQGVAA